jgi:subtilisin family serine protease
VVGVTGVDAHNRVLPEAGRGAQVDFAAPGSDIAAAGPGGRYVTVRGTSFAAPIVAALIARGLGAPDPSAAARAEAALAQEAVDLGARGADPVYGAGLVGADLRAAMVARR